MRSTNEWLGSAEGPSGTYLVDTYCTLKLVYTAGKYGIDDGGSIRIARRGGMRPQVDDPKAPGFTTIKSARNVRFVADSIPFTKQVTTEDGLLGTPTATVRAGHIRPFWNAFQIDVKDGSLHEGDKVEITFGDLSQGSPGIHLKTIREEQHVFRVFVDPFGTGFYKPIDNPPFIKLIGNQGEEMQVVGPSEVVAGQNFKLTVRVLDGYHNRSDLYRGTVSFNSPDAGAVLPSPYSFTEGDAGAHTFFGATLSEHGIQHISVSDDIGLRAISNPIIVLTHKPKLKLFWGDMHGQTRETVGTGTVPQYLSFAKNVAGLDFASWQGNDFQVTRCLWEHVKDQIKKRHEPGSFVTFLGYEWSGLTPAGGDHNIYYLGDDEPIHRSDHWQIEDKSDAETDRYPISELWREFKGRKDVLAVPHVGGRYGNFDFFDPEHIPLIEVHSNHGTFEWFLEEAMRRRMKVGFIAASDDHTCRPGLTYPSEGMSTRGGYTGVYAEELTREALWEAFWARRTYGTTGERIIVYVEADGHLMGEEFTAHKAPEVKVRVFGTLPLHAVEIYDWEQIVYRHPFADPSNDEEKLIKVEWSGARVRSRSKVVKWDGCLTIENGEIIDFKEFAFDYPYHGVKKVSNRELMWTSTTGGDPDGVVLKLKGGEDTEVTFKTEHATFRFKPEDVQYEPRVIDAGGVNQRVKVSSIKVELPDSLEFAYKADTMEKCLHAYWVRVVQSDGAMAWSSPLFINYT